MSAEASVANVSFEVFSEDTGAIAPVHPRAPLGLKMSIALRNQHCNERNV